VAGRGGAARVGSAAAPMTLRPSWPRPAGLGVKADAEATQPKVKRELVEPVEPVEPVEQVRAEPRVVLPRTGIEEAGPVVIPPAGISEDGVVVEEPVRPAFGRERRAVDDGIVLPEARRELNETGRARSEVVAGGG